MRTIFVAVDCQNDFMLPSGKLYVPGAETIIPNLEKLTIFAEDNAIQTISTMDWHNANTQEISDKPDFKQTFPPHCLAGTDGAELIKEVAPYCPSVVDWDTGIYTDVHLDIFRGSDELIIRKDKFDLFEGNPFAAKIIQKIQPDVAVVYGVAADVCVNFAAMGLLKKGIRTYIVADAIKALPNCDVNQLVKTWIEAGIRFVLLNENENTGNPFVQAAKTAVGYNIRPYYLLSDVVENH